MRIRAWRAFASNNSGSYTLVGSFKDAETAAAVAAELGLVIQAHDDWFREDENNQWKMPAPEDSPLQAFIRDKNLNPNPDAGVGDTWPAYGSTPAVLAVDTQILIHVDYTATMAPSFGEYFFQHGGRVSQELDHSHGPLGTRFQFWDRKHYAEDNPRLAALLAALQERPASVDPHTNIAIPAIARVGEWRGVIEYISVPTDPVEEARALTALAKAHALGVQLHVLDLPGGDDPIAHLRATRDG